MSSDYKNMTDAELKAIISAPDPKYSQMSEEQLMYLAGESNISKAESALRGLGQGLTLGSADEIMGAIASGYINLTGNASLFDRPYQQARDSIRADTAAAQAANPGTFGTAEFAGAVAPILATGGASTLPQAMARGGVYGATYGAGEAAELADVPGAALKGAALGAGGAGGLGLLGKGVGLGGRGLLKGGDVVKRSIGKPAAPLTLTPGDIATGMAAMATGGGPAAALTAVGTKKLVGAGFSKLSVAKQTSVANKLTKYGGKFGKWSGFLQSKAAQGGESLVAAVNSLKASDPEFARVWNSADNEDESVNKLRNEMQSVQKQQNSLLGQQNLGLLNSSHNL